MLPGRVDRVMALIRVKQAIPGYECCGEAKQRLSIP